MTGQVLQYGDVVRVALPEEIPSEWSRLFCFVTKFLTFNISNFPSAIRIVPKGILGFPPKFTRFALTSPAPVFRIAFRVKGFVLNNSYD